MRVHGRAAHEWIHQRPLPAEGEEPENNQEAYSVEHPVGPIELVFALRAQGIRMVRVFPLVPVRNLADAMELAGRNIDLFVTEHHLYVKLEDWKG